MPSKAVEDCIRICKLNADGLRKLGEAEQNNNAKKMLLEAAHHLDVGLAELEYVMSGSTVSI